MSRVSKECIEAKNVTRRFREWSKCSMHMWKRCLEAKGLVEFHELLARLEGSKSWVFKRDQGTQMSPTTRSLATPSSTKDKVRLPLTRLPHFMDRIGPLIGCLSRCRFEIDTSSYEPPPSLSKMKKLKLLRKLLVDISASVLVGRLGLDTGSSIVFDSIVFCSRIGQVRKAKAFQQPSSNKYHVRHSR